MFDSANCVRYVIIFLGSLGKVGAIIEFTKPRGRVTPE